MVRLLEYRASAGGFVKMALMDLAGSAEVTGVDIAASGQVGGGPPSNGRAAQAAH